MVNKNGANVLNSSLRSPLDLYMWTMKTIKSINRRRRNFTDNNNNIRREVLSEMDSSLDRILWNVGQGTEKILSNVQKINRSFSCIFVFVSNKEMSIELDNGLWMHSTIALDKFSAAKQYIKLFVSNSLGQPRWRCFTLTEGVDYRSMNSERTIRDILNWSPAFFVWKKSIVLYMKARTFERDFPRILMTNIDEFADS